MQLTFQHEARDQKSETDKQIERLQNLLHKKNTYFDKFKTDEALLRIETEEANKEAKTFGYDKVFAHYDEKIAGSPRYEDRKLPKITRRGGVGSPREE